MELSISDDALAEIGKITVLFSHIEWSLSEIIARIVTVGGRVRELGLIVTAELSFRQRINTVNSLLRLALGDDSPVVADFSRVKALLERASDERNSVVHSVWAEDLTPASASDVVRIRSTARRKKGLHVEFVSLTLDDLARISQSIAEACVELCVFETQFHPSTETEGSESASE